MDKIEIFQILGIEYTKDEHLIKNAYREKLAVTNPEDNPEGFKRLRAAYEEACRLAKQPEEYAVGDILRLTEGSFALVACLEKKQNPCQRSAGCKTLKMWKDFQKLTEDYFDNITIADLAGDSQGADNYVI